MTRVFVAPVPPESDFDALAHINGFLMDGEQVMAVQPFNRNHDGRVVDLLVTVKKRWRRRRA